MASINDLIRPRTKKVRVYKRFKINNIRGRIPYRNLESQIDRLAEEERAMTMYEHARDFE